MAVVPARLYERQYLGWPKMQQEGNHDNGIPVANTSTAEDLEAEEVQDMLAWLKDFGFEERHETNCPVAAEGDSPLFADLLDFSTPEVVDIDHDGIFGEEASHLEAESTTPIFIDAEDEGYFTCGETEEDGFDLARTIEGDDGDEWDWVTDLESQLIEKKHGDWDDSSAW